MRINYYPITDHDYGSSLTPALHVQLACDLDLLETAYEMFLKGALVDLEDRRGNTAEGIHTACCGAVWQAVVLGFAGLTITEDGYYQEQIAKFAHLSQFSVTPPYRDVYELIIQEMT